MTRATFYFDLGSPYAYLANERLRQLFSEPPDLQPISLGALFKLTGRSSWSLGDPERRRAGMAEVERRARERGLPPLRWPRPWPGNYLTAMRAATFAQRAGRGGEFATHAFRAAFQRGLDLSLPEQVFEVAGDAGLDPGEVERATGDAEIKLALREATESAHALGVFGVPSVALAGELYWGDDRLQEAAARISALRDT